MNYLTIDLETRSDIDISVSGVYKYAESPDFDILLISVSIDGGKVIIYDLACGDIIPIEIVEALSDEKVIKRAFNANFERICLSVYVRRNYSYILENQTGSYFSPKGWQCDMIHARYLGFPSSLDEVGRVLKIKQQKLEQGKVLIKYFCTPNKNGNFNSPDSDSDKWEQFKSYNKRDVEAELEIQKRLSSVPVPDFVWKEYWLSEQINDRGILVDTDFAEQAINISNSEKSRLLAEMKSLTGLSNPNSVVQMKNWLKKKGIICDSLDKTAVSELIKKVPDDVKNVLLLRQQLSKSSVKKYEAMLNSVCCDAINKNVIYSSER